MQWTMLLLMALVARPAAAQPIQECRLADCLAAVETFPPEPCAKQPLPRDVRRRVRQVQSAVNAEADGQDPPIARPARAVVKWLRRATMYTKEAAAEGKLTAECAEILQGYLRNARACASCPALREAPGNRRFLESS